MKRLELKLELRRCSTARRSVHVEAKEARAEARAEELKMPKRSSWSEGSRRVKLELKT